MKYRVLLVDDEPLILKSIERIINWTEYDCEVVGVALDGKEALELVLQFDPHLVITDINMPEMNGIELLKTVRTRSRKPEVILLSGYDEFEYAREGLHHQAFSYLLKPIDHEELSKVIKQVINVIQEKEENQYERMKHFFYELLTLGKINVAQPDIQSTFVVIAIQYQKHTDSEERLLLEWINRQQEESTSLLFLYKLEKNRYFVVTSDSNDNGKLLHTKVKRKVLQFKEQFTNGCTVAISDPTSQVNELNLLYEQALELLETNNLIKLDVITSEDIKEDFKATNTSKVLVEQAETYIRNHFNEDISIETVAGTVGLSVSHFSVLFKQRTGVTFLNYVTNMRIQHACMLLKKTDLKTYEIASKIGYLDQRYFSQVFKKRVGMTPSVFREKGNIE